MKHQFLIEEYLKVIKDFQIQFPFAHVGGSIGLFLHGIDLKRSIMQSDIDMVMDDYLPADYNLAHYHESSSPSDFDYRFTVDLPNDYYMKMEIRVTPEPSFDVINYKGELYNVSRKRDIVFWKQKYANQGNQKHIDDLTVINTGKRPILPDLSAKYTRPRYKPTYHDDDSNLPF